MAYFLGRDVKVAITLESADKAIGYSSGAISVASTTATPEGMFERDTYNNSLDYVTLGLAEDSIWTRKFKFRIKSTTSGKIIDYNVKFKLTKDKTEEDF